MKTITKKLSTTIAQLKANPLRAAFVIIMTALFAAMPIMSRNAGISGDEHSNMQQSEYVLNYYKTFGRDTTAIIPMGKDKNMREYGQLPDNLVYAAVKILGIDDIMAARHAACSLLGWLCILFAGLLAFAASGSWLCAIMAAALLFLSPRYVGHSFNNLKDVPFAAAMTMGVYFIYRFLQCMPKPPLRICAGLAVSIAFAIATRVGGLLLIAYFGLFAAVWLGMQWFKYKKTKGSKKKLQPPPLSMLLKRLLVYGILISMVGYALAVLCWPYALAAPLKNVMATFEAMSLFKQNIRQLFEGQQQWSVMLPWYYTPKYIIITAPIAVLAGLTAYLFAGALRRENRFATFVVYFSFVFPIFWIIYSHANVYGGWRHSLFAYPPMVVAAALGFNGMVNAAKKKYAKYALAALPLLLLINPMLFVLKNHPYEVTYFNPIVGGIKGAYGNYEMDYYYHSSREAALWVQRDIMQGAWQDSARKAKVVSWHAASAAYYLRHDTARASVAFCRWYERGWNDWDYGVFTITGIVPELLKSKKAFPPKNTAYQVMVDGVPIALVLKRSNKEDYYGHAAMKEGRIDHAVRHLRAALEYDAYNEQALEDLINIYGQIGRMDSALMLCQGWLTFNKGNTTALAALANLYYAAGKPSDALLAAGQILRYNKLDITGLWIIANIYAQQGKSNDAVRTLQRLLQIRPDHKPAYMLMADLYERSGDKRQAEEIRRAVQ